MERLLVVGDKEKEVKNIFREERVERIGVDSEVAVVSLEATTELVAVVVTLREVEVGLKLFPVGEREDILKLGQINETNVVMIAMNMIKWLSHFYSEMDMATQSSKWSEYSFLKPQIWKIFWFLPRVWRCALTFRFKVVCFRVQSLN